MCEIETDCYIGNDGLAYTNVRTYMSLAERPIDGLFVHPTTGLIRNQSAAVIQRHSRR